MNYYLKYIARTGEVGNKIIMYAKTNLINKI